jgi:FMN phosphatase YigB (HAD superfamily)
MKVKAILLDLVGTLAYNEKRPPDPIEASKLLRKMGYEVYYQEWEAARKFVFFIDSPKGNINSWADFIRKIFERLQIKPDENVIKKISEYYKNNTRFRFFDDVKTVKRLLLKKGIVTTIPIFYFSDLDLKDFDVIITGKEAGAAKPNPRCFIKPLEILNIRPEEALFVGDDVECDIVPAKELGMGVALIDRKGIHKNVRYPKIASLAELKELLKI